MQSLSSGLFSLAFFFSLNLCQYTFQRHWKVVHFTDKEEPCKLSNTLFNSNPELYKYVMYIRWRIKIVYIYIYTYQDRQGFSQPSRQAECRYISFLAKQWSGWRCNKIYLHEMQMKLHFSPKDVLFASICGWNPVRLLKTSSSRRREACLTLRQTLKWALAMA